jgi:recombinational DNA repair protein (RecF pathway)
MLLFWFEIRLMALLGFAPQLNRCSTCGGGLAESSLLVFSVGGGGIVCPSCAGSQSRAQSVPLSPDVLAILRQWQKADAPRVPLSTRCTAAQLHALRKVLGAFLEFHLNLPVVPRSAALRWIEADPLALADAERQQQQGGLDEESHSRTESGGSGRLSAV